jgi:predicted  nucleic acid-binding Zn-ribbon protein
LEVAKQDREGMEAKLLKVEELLDASTKKLQAAKESLIKLEQDLRVEAKSVGAVGMLDKKMKSDCSSR